MSLEFATILQGLLGNRGLSITDVSHASSRARSTIQGLLNGRFPPKVETLQDIAPVLGIDLADLLVIAGVPTDLEPYRPTPYGAPSEIVQLVIAAATLSPEQVNHLVDLARDLRAKNMEAKPN